jgi:hypothetical protein
MAAKTRVRAPKEPSVACPNCRHLQQAADRRWVEMQDLRARLMGYETVLSEYVWLVTEAAASELDQRAWNARLDEARGRALDLLRASGVGGRSSRDDANEARDSLAPH